MRLPLALSLGLMALACAPPDDAENGGRDTTAAMTAMDPVQAKIAQAVQAGPAELTAGATVMDWPDSTGQMAELRPGTNGWLCLPASPAPPDTDWQDAMCLDRAWQAWAQAYMTKAPVPAFTGIGVGYMLLGDRPASNVDPFATGPTPDNQWVHEGPHIMLIVPDPRLLDGISTDPHNGGPYVMWKGTPYAHVMVPLR